jgi:uncharacterized Zn-binding protein involved in type VI secretion
MPAAARLGDPTTTGHACDATTTILGALVSTVRINNIVAAVNGDLLAPHTILAGISCVPHTANVNVGSSTVRIENIAAARVGDSADVGAITSGSNNVSIGG